jgi:hypothetical protein
MSKQDYQSLALKSAKETWTLGVVSIGLLFILSVLTTIILKGDFTINIFGIESYRSGNASGIKVGWEAAVGFLCVLPVIAAGLSIYRSRN